MSQHTPGPWAARYSPKTRNTAIESVPDTGNIGLVHGGLDPDCAADARLVAAAPELLEAVRAAANTIALLGGMNLDENSVGDTLVKDAVVGAAVEIYEQLRSAITKATGESA